MASKQNISSTNNEGPFNEEFCNYLEYHLCKTFQNSNLANVKWLWCDGISHVPTSDKQLTAKNVNDTRKIVTKAWIGKDGQDEYKMTIHFGKQALSRYAKEHSLIDCLPGEETMDWINIDPEQKIIEIQLK